MQRTVTRQMSFDLTKLLVTEDWFSDISPQTMRRLLNIVSVTGNTSPIRLPLYHPRGRVDYSQHGTYYRKGSSRCFNQHTNVTSHWSIFQGRLLRANQIIFNWDRLASWINLTEEWPYRTSWLILFLEETDGISDQIPLKTIYERYVHTHLYSNKHACTGRHTHTHRQTLTF